MIKLCIYLINKFYQASLCKFLFKKIKGSVFLPGISFFGSSKAVRRRKSASTERCRICPLWDAHPPQWPSAERKVGHLLGTAMVLGSPVIFPHPFVLSFGLRVNGLEGSVVPFGPQAPQIYPLSPATPGVGDIWCSGPSGSFLI